MSLADQASVLGFRVGWSLVRRMPGAAAYALFDQIAGIVHRRGGKDVDRMRSNYARVRPELTPSELEDLVGAGLRSYFRYWCDAFRLPDLSTADLDGVVQLSGAGDEAKAIVDGGQSVVLFLGHLGNWDLAGAWATTYFHPVTTVAERLKPEELFLEFLAFREQLGMTILPLTGGVDVFPTLRAAAQDGACIPLLSDRDLTNRGVTVRLCGHEARVAAGPARLALETGAALYPVSITYLPPNGRGARRVQAHFGPRVVDPGTGTDRERVTAMTQQCADSIGVAITTHTQDWHMMQRVFVADLS